ncbi:TolC family protein [Fulvivirga sp. 29W222]|uniref:TolC family protein n=1 Tax=Fulvivirga marina TaxID=2494733 RepID=A0A937KDR3_9BACT|nr:TolC family protein [Fulvivirga marina]MBL6448907.1 TolC family protein [Fulvivirga marina]
MRKLIILTIVLLPLLVKAQNVDYNAIILPNNVTDISFEEKLVRLAWQNNPANKILDYQANISNIEVKQARWSWLDDWRVQGNLNEFTINDNADVGDRAQFYPKYNVTGMIRLSYFVDIPLEVKKKKQEVLISKSNTNLQKLAIRAEVLTRYQTYLMNRELLKIQTEIVEDLYASLSLAEQQFKNGEITLNAYNIQQDRYNNQRVKQINAQGDFNISKIAIEEMIGMRLEDVQ